MPGDYRPWLSAIRYEAGFDINRILRELAVDLRRRAFHLGGVLQQLEMIDGSGCARMSLVDIRSGETTCITEERGKGARGCKLDMAGLVNVSHCIEQAIEARVDLIIVNKFGKAEADGGGFRACIANAIASAIPVLTAVREPYHEAWEIFHGGLAADLPPRMDAITRWCEVTREDSRCPRT